MNVFTFLFVLVWVGSAISLIFQLRAYLRRRKNRKSCKYCRHYPACSDLAWLQARDLSLPLYCSGFERKSVTQTRRSSDSPAPGSV